MKTKLYWIVLVLLTAILMFSITAVANANKEVKIFKPYKSFIDEDDIKDVIASKIAAKGAYKRVIADDIDEDDIKLFKNKGCFIKHRLKHSASFECPEDVISKLKVREARIFHILDLEADQQIKADQVWAEGINGEGVNVVILDTGVDSSHIELSDSIKGQKDFVNNDDIAEDPNGHGTHVAGIITANGVYKNIDGNNDATGVSPGAGIYMLKVCDASGSCYEDDMIAAMEYAVNSLDAKIMSISIGGGNFGDHCDSDPLAAKVNWVVDNGFTVVVAAGNEGKGVSSPACASKAIAVGAVDKNGIVPYWSNRGPALDIVAPGVDILSTYSCLAAGDCSYYWYAYMSGTSMSAPHVSGVVALLLETKPTATLDEIKNALYSTASPATKCYKCTRWSGGRCRSQGVVECTPEIQGAGIVNAYEAYLAVKPTAPVCSSDADCNDNLYCNGIEKCQVGVCQSGTAVDCSGLNDQCNVGVCNEATDSCIAQPANEGLACNDGLFCNVGETCKSGICTGGSAYICNDNNVCTTDNCNEENDACEFIPIPECSAKVKCWSADYKYLSTSMSQAKKFCKCAAGIYDYKDYSSISSRANAYQYVDSTNNENWKTRLVSNFYRPIYRVKCTDGNWYKTNQDYYYPK